jgi:hypothetical protein
MPPHPALKRPFVQRLDHHLVVEFIPPDPVRDGERIDYELHEGPVGAYPNRLEDTGRWIVLSWHASL